MSVPFTHKVSMDSSFTSAYRNPWSNNSYYQWVGHEGFHLHVERATSAGQPISESELLRFLAMPFNNSYTRSKKVSAEEFKDFYDKQRKRLVKFRKDIEKCASNLVGEPTFIVVTPPGYGRSKRYKVTLYATPIDDIQAWKDAVIQYNSNRRWADQIQYSHLVKHYAEFMQRLKANINYLATFDPTPHVEKHAASFEDEQTRQRIISAQNFFGNNLDKKTDDLKALALWDDPEWLKDYIETQRNSIRRRIAECDARLRQHVESLIRYGAELTEEQQAYAPEVTE